MKKPTMFQIQEAVRKNICGPGEDELEDFSISRSIRASTKREGDSQVGLLLFVGVCDQFGFTFADITAIISLEREEYRFKLSKYKRKLKSNDARFLNKVKLINNYLRLKYAVTIL